MGQGAGGGMVYSEFNSGFRPLSRESIASLSVNTKVAPRGSCFDLSTLVVIHLCSRGMMPTRPCDILGGGGEAREMILDSGR